MKAAPFYLCHIITYCKPFQVNSLVQIMMIINCAKIRAMHFSERKRGSLKKQKTLYTCEEQIPIFGWKNSFLNPIIFKGVGWGIFKVGSTPSPYLDPVDDMQLISFLCWLMAREWQISALCQQGEPHWASCHNGRNFKQPR